MKALLIIDDNVAIERFSVVLKSAGYDVIVYRWLMKALDNIEEIAPHLIIISVQEYPRHWKTIAQYIRVGIVSIVPQIILFTGTDFSDDERKKASVLGIRGIFSSYDVDGLDTLRAILERTDDIFSGNLETDEKQIADNSIQFIFTDPDTNALVTGLVLSYVNSFLTFIPDYYSIGHFPVDKVIPCATFSYGNAIKSVTAIVKQTGKVLEFLIKGQ
jgi:hypothetical protein